MYTIILTAVFNCVTNPFAVQVQTLYENRHRNTTKIHIIESYIYMYASHHRSPCQLCGFPQIIMHTGALGQFAQQIQCAAVRWCVFCVLFR